MTALVNTETGEIVESLTTDQARRLTDRIRLMGESVADHLDKMAGLIDDARTRSAWLALGYRSWTDYVATEFAGIIPRLDREPRQELVRDLSSRGMSTRAIAPIIGVHHDTVASDLRSPVGNPTPETPEVEGNSASGVRDPAPTEATPRDNRPVDYPEAPAPAPRPPVTGLDGKSYSRPPLIDHRARASQAVAEFPDLAYYEGRDPEHCWRLADTLRKFVEPELTERIATLRRSIDIDRSKRDGTYRAPSMAGTPTCPTCGQTMRN